MQLTGYSVNNYLKHSIKKSFYEVMQYQNLPSGTELGFVLLQMSTFFKSFYKPMKFHLKILKFFFSMNCVSYSGNSITLVVCILIFIYSQPVYTSLFLCQYYSFHGNMF